MPSAGKEEALFSKEVDEDEDEEEEALEKYISYMGGDDCKEPARAWVDCMVEAEKNKEDMDTKCCQHASTIEKCMNSHRDQYQPLLALATTRREHMRRGLEEALGIEIPKKGTFRYL
ncbi:unnamed protein product [Microthlaspi erraticum]|uniref:GCK domain-containing protein n=1 Tax=Microthlaspi erraticum TaxID=1685480 RepID=A0A6D2KR91_9BRAS|nr:unnamed protein product [Microthlaspi erraticum]